MSIYTQRKFYYWCIGFFSIMRRPIFRLIDLGKLIEATDEQA